MCTLWIRRITFRQLSDSLILANRTFSCLNTRFYPIENKNLCSAIKKEHVERYLYHSIKIHSVQRSEKKFNQDNITKSYKESESNSLSHNEDDIEAAKKLGLFARFKLMYKQYWYVLIPVHVITSIGWYGGFYYMSKSGVDIASLMETVHFSEILINKIKNSSMGHLAIAYLCYKIATPVRYMVTLGGTTVSIKYLKEAGYIKPVPTKAELLRMYEAKKIEVKRKLDSKTDKTK